MITNYYLGCLCCFLLLLNSLFSTAQNTTKPIKNWNTLGINIRVLPNTSISVNQLYGFNTQVYRLSFIQNSISTNIKIKKHLSLGFGHSHSFIFKSDYTQIKYQLHSSYAISNRILKWSFNNAFMLEYHSKEETKYRFRILYTFRTKPRKKLVLQKFKISPFATIRLYYNIGGKRISQYNSRGEKIGKYPTNGFHRIRFMLGIKTKISNNIGLQLQLMKQKEFNTDFAYKNKLNVHRPNSDKISRPFSNYMMLGFGIKYYLDLKQVVKYQKRNRRKNKQQIIPNRNWTELPASQGF